MSYRRRTWTRPTAAGASRSFSAAASSASICFFFSSRRLHTRLQGDWSSDVCSSDLTRRVGGRLHHRATLGHGGKELGGACHVESLARLHVHRGAAKSEEVRLGGRIVARRQLGDEEGAGGIEVDGEGVRDLAGGDTGQKLLIDGEALGGRH